jgi:hypothetical protein
VAGVVARALEPRIARRRPAQPLVVQEFHHVANLRGERADLVGRDEVAELLEVGATSGRVRHDDVRVGERAKVSFGERSRGVETPVVRREGSAADLCAGDDHTPAVASQHADRRAVHSSEPPILDAPAQQRDGPAHLARRLRHARQAAEHLRGRRQRSDASGGKTREWPQGGRERNLLPRQRDIEPSIAKPRPARSQGFDLSARSLDHPAERHVRRAHVLARAAREAEVHEARERLVGVGQPLGDRTHRRDPAPGGRRLFAGDPVGGAVGQAQPARDAGGQVLVGRRVEREPPPGFVIRVPADEPDAGRHVAAQDDVQGRLHQVILADAIR